MSDKMREALKLADAALSGANMNMAVVKRKISEALAEQPAQGDAACVLTIDNAGQHMSYEVGACSLPIGTHALYTALPAPSVLDGMVDKSWQRFEAELAQPSPVAWGMPNTAITGKKMALMMVRLDIPSDDQYGGAMWVPLYTAPPAPSVPDALRESYGCNPSYINGWNACRAAMLAAGGKPVVPDRWKQPTFTTLAAAPEVKP